MMMMISKFVVGCAVVFLCNPNPVFARQIICNYIKCLQGTSMYVTDKDDGIMMDSWSPTTVTQCRDTRYRRVSDDSDRGCPIHRDDGTEPSERCDFKKSGMFSNGLHHCRACGRIVCSEALSPNGEINNIIMHGMSSHKSCTDCFAKAQEINEQYPHKKITGKIFPGADEIVKNIPFRKNRINKRKEAWRQHLMCIRLGFATINKLYTHLKTGDHYDEFDEVIRHQWSLIHHIYKDFYLLPDPLAEKVFDKDAEMENLKSELRARYEHTKLDKDIDLGKYFHEYKASEPSNSSVGAALVSLVSRLRAGIMRWAPPLLWAAPAASVGPTQTPHTQDEGRTSERNELTFVFHESV